MSEKSAVARITLQVYALAFLGIGVGAGCLLGYRIGAVSDGVQADMTVIPRTADQPQAFNWLFFAICFGAGLVSCAVLLAASVLVDRD